MRVVEAEELRAQLRSAPFRLSIIRRAHEKPPARAFFGRIRQRHRGGNPAVSANERAATFVWERLFTVAPDHARDARVELRLFPHSSAVQNDSLRYFSAPSGNTVTTTPVFSRRATVSVALSAAPAEIPTRSPSS